ncbi:MAG TPA: response regulator [Bryobacteraceae bacterium]|jgi:CheY-like chemotaxis protein|nr:response regulator [Bryobacteraceae bacterium]
MDKSSSRKCAPPARILLIDDNQMGLSARKSVLEELGYSITASTCADEALTHFRTEKYDLVVTDYKMPSMDGIQLITQVRRCRPDVPVILLSGFADALGLDEASTGADVIIQKSSHEVTSLVRSVQRLLTRKPPKKAAAVQGSSARASRKSL